MKFKIGDQVFVHSYKTSYRKKYCNNKNDYPNEGQIVTICRRENCQSTPVYFFNEVKHGAFEDELQIATKLHKVML